MIYKHDHDFKFSNDRFGLNGILIGVCKNVLSSSKINDRYFAFSLKCCIFASNFRSSHFEPEEKGSKPGKKMSVYQQTCMKLKWYKFIFSVIKYVLRGLFVLHLFL